MAAFTVSRRPCVSIRRRAAMSLLEVTIAAALLTALMVVSTQLIRALGGHQRAVERHALAMRTVQGLAEQISNTPWEELTPDAAARMEIPQIITPHLPDSNLAVAVQEEHEPIAAKRVSIELQWTGPYGRQVAPARLTTWVFQDELSLK